MDDVVVVFSTSCCCYVYMVKSDILVFRKFMVVWCVVCVCRVNGVVMMLLLLL